jgi:chorismate synthase
MTETTTEVRADIDQTRARMSGAIAELERKVDVTQKVRDNPWSAVAVAFGAGVALSASKADVKAAQATTQATKETGSKLGGALDGVVAALIAGVAEAFHSRIDAMVNEVVTSIRGDSTARSVARVDRGPEPPTRAD